MRNKRQKIEKTIKNQLEPLLRDLQDVDLPIEINRGSWIDKQTERLEKIRDLLKKLEPEEGEVDLYTDDFKGAF